MALKRKLTKDEFEKLNDILKGEYKHNSASGNYELDAEDDDKAELLRAKQYEVDKRKELEVELKKLKENIDKNNYDSTKGKGNVEELEKLWMDKNAALEKSWNEKHNLTVKELSEKNATLRSQVKNSILESHAKTLASELFTIPSVMMRSVMDRLDVDFSDNGPVLKVLDAERKPSASTLDDLRKELLANKEFSSILIASKARGGATPMNAPRIGDSESTVDLARVSPSQLAEIIKNKTEGK